MLIDLCAYAKETKKLMSIISIRCKNKLSSVITTKARGLVIKVEHTCVQLVISDHDLPETKTRTLTLIPAC